MQELVILNYGKHNIQVNKSDLIISDIEKDILEYISGYILKKNNYL